MPCADSAPEEAADILADDLKKEYASLEGMQREINRKDRTFDLMLEVLKPWPENAGGRFAELRQLARDGKS